MPGGEEIPDAAEPEAQPTDTPEMPVDEIINRYGVTTSKVNYRKAPGKDAGKYGEIPKDTHVYLIYTQANKAGELWTLVEAEGHTGYLMSEYLTVLTQEDSDAYNLAQPSPAPEYLKEDIFPTEAPTAEPTDTPEPEITAEPTPEPTPTPEATAAPEITEGEMINRYGTTNAGKLGFREQPDKDGKLITRLDKGMMVYLLRADTGSDGESWTFVEVNGRKGYIKTEYLNLFTKEDSAAWDSLQATPAPVYTEEDVFPKAEETETPAPTEEVTETPEPEKTEEPTKEPTPTDTPTAEPEETAAPMIPAGEVQNRYAKTNKKVYFRKDASTSAGKIGELKKNTYVYMIYTKEAEDGDLWTYAMVNGKEGFIKTVFLDSLTEEDSAAHDQAQKTPAPVYTQEEFFPTAAPTEVVTLEPTEEPSVAPTETPTEAPTSTPTEAPTATPTEAPTATPTQAPTEAPTETPTAAPTEAPTEAPTATPTPAPTEAPATPTLVPYQRVGYAITIGDGVPLRKWPSSSSAIKQELPANKIVYVNGQEYEKNTAWSYAETDSDWGFIRADMLRMISQEELKAYQDLIESLKTPEPSSTTPPYSYDPDELSCYGYVTTDAVNFRTEPSSSSGRIRQMKKYALFIVYGTEKADGETWYKVSYNNQVGYVNGRYFKQMTVSEAEEFLQSSKYREGIANNQNTGSNDNTSPATTGSPAGATSPEDQRVEEWVNPATGSTVSYEPFDPFATPEPLSENELEKNEFVNSLIKQVQEGTLKEEDIKTELEKFYKDAANPEEAVAKALAYIQEKLGLQTEQPSESPEPLETVEPENPQEESSGGSSAGLIIAIIAILAAAGGGGYYWYIQKQRKRENAQKAAQKKVAQQNKAMAGKEGARPSRPASAQNGAKVRTGTYTETTGSSRPKATPSTPAGGQGTGKTYGTGQKNPYARYSANDTEEDNAYTASFKPNTDEEKTPQDKKDEKPAE